jgi:hypothetical protein
MSELKEFWPVLFIAVALGYALGGLLHELTRPRAASLTDVLRETYRELRRLVCAAILSPPTKGPR